MSRSDSPELALVGLGELSTLDRWNLENRARGLAHAIYLGDGTMLCRVMGRYKLYVPASDAGFGVHVMMEGMWEGWLTVFMARRIKPGMVAIDVGANHGYYTTMFAEMVGETGRVVAFEPNPATAALLRKTLFVNGLDQRVRVIEAAAVASDDHTVSFYADITEPKNARVVGAEHAAEAGVINVAGVTLDAVLADLPRIDFMKVDVEGAEEDTIAGAMTVIARDKPDLLLEFNILRCKDPVGLLDRLEAIYGRIRVVTYEATLVMADRSQLLDQTRTEDWSLFLSVN
jgi:FkbM family methyltransferase